MRCALKEDVGSGDITTNTLFPEAKTIRASIIAKENGTLSGMEVAMAAFKLLGSDVKFMPLILDGGTFKSGAIIAHIEGKVQAILAAERTALNFLSRLSGIATLTSEFTKAVKPYKTEITDTRKTTPGLRALEKYAVTCGGGRNHRMGLYDQILIKDNHLKAGSGVKGLRSKVIEEARKRGIKTEIEVENLKQFKEAFNLKPDIIMLDNMRLADIKAAVKLRKYLSTKLEASGGVTLKNVRRIAATGVDMISVGALTHSARPIDFSLEITRDGS